LGKAPKRVIVDTYALMAKATGEITSKADKYLEDVRAGKLIGVIHPIITYEFLLQVHKCRIPILKTAKEALDFLQIYFLTINLQNPIASMAAEIRFKSESFLTKLKRHLSVCDSVTIAIAKDTRIPIISGDHDLQIVAKEEGVEVIW
jgi:predicted nucleic acid-binding protein